MARRRRRTPPFDVRIDGLADTSCSYGEHEGKRVLVRGAAPGSVVHVRPFKLKKGVIHARRVEIVEPAPDAVEPRCAVFGLCGGCSLQDAPLATQRQAKHDMVLDTLGELDEAVVVHPMRGDDAGYGYRNKVELSFGVKRYLTQADQDAGVSHDGRWLGFHAPGRFDRVVDTDRCELVPPGLNTVIAEVRAHLQTSALEPWSVREHTGYWKHLVLREATTGERLVAFYTASEEGEDELVALAERLDARVLWFVNESVADAAIGRLHRVLRGPEHIDEVLAGTRYRLSATAFFQTNTRATEVLYATIAEAAGTGDRLLDLYCGTGAIGLYLQDRFTEVLGVELNPASVEDARQNAARNERDVTYVCGKVEDVLPELGPTDIAIVDPPRVGLHPTCSAWLAAAPLSTLVYVACKPSSLARDRAILEAGGWVLEAVWTVDLFPQTGHIEAVARFVRPDTDR
ncbi:MAG: 23S rRNA (uracil(1939)-C(5))-methyltransferase RlmD [Proteobacteria bacterium]|nr:23S rRNA (uracil(1939)-C(5))-methyltransferase RlmD [Pseudomonadota bacterium]MCP4919978.1 23S rRNA (uracil(1939)-C(5))-methyltransferase RlmD [Pseudomonadota bacterium]